MREPWKVSFEALLAAEFLAIMGFQTSTPILPLYLRDLGVVDPAALNFWNGIINASTSLALALVAPIWGALADSYGKKPMLLRATIAGAVVLSLMAVVNAPWQLLALKTIQGILTGTVAAATVLTATIVPAKEAGYRLGLLQVSIYLGSSVGPLVGGVISDLFGNRANFLVTGLLLALASFLVQRFVKEEAVTKPRSGNILAKALPDFGVLRETPLLAGLLIAIFSVQLANGTANPILPLIILDYNGNAAGTASLVGLIIGAGALAGAGAAAFVGKAGARIGYGRALVACLALAVLFYVPQGLTRDPWFLLALRIASGAFLGGSIPTVNALLARHASRERQGAVFGLASSMSSGGAAIGPMVGALVATGFGYSAVFFATAAILAVATLILLRGIREKKRDSGGAKGRGSGPVLLDATMAE